MISVAVVISLAVAGCTEAEVDDQRRQLEADIEALQTEISELNTITTVSESARSALESEVENEMSRLEEEQAPVLGLIRSIETRAGQIENLEEAGRELRREVESMQDEISRFIEEFG